MDQVDPPDPFTVLYQDEDLVAVLKPSGFAVHPGWAPKERSLLGPLRDQLSSYLFPVHRLDRGTSGVVIFALNRDAARALNQQFQQRTVKKRYLAWVRGHPKTGGGYLEHDIPARPGGPRVPAQTSWIKLHPLDTTPRETSLLAVAPRTGRMHQIRRHLSHLNHPILGDSRYGRPKLNRAFRKGYAMRRLALHAWAIEVTQPVSQRSLRVTAPLPESLHRPLGSAGFLVSQLVDPWSLLFPEHQETSPPVPLD